MSHPQHWTTDYPTYHFKPAADAPEPDAYALFSYVGSKASLTSRAISLKTDGPVSHVDWIEPVTELLWGARFDKVGGAPRGFYPRPVSYIAKETVRVVVALPCTRHELDRMRSVTHRDKGTPYDWLGIFGIGLDEDWHTRGARFCSEAQALHGEESGLTGQLFGAAWHVSPMALLLAHTAIKGHVIVSRRGC